MNFRNKMFTLLTGLYLIIPTTLSAAEAVDSAAENPGAMVFQKHCYDCHHEGQGAGTMRLKERSGEAMSLLEERKDLVPTHVRHVVRNGLLAMPPFRPTIITDAELETLINYLVTQ